ncbi:MAG: EscU/YscU/HrcU family type III secretion system export apparatus switch protein [Roseicyclus sp.]
MSDENQSPGEKPHDPTSRKLEQAREKGEIVRSADLNGAVMFFGVLLAGGLFAGALFEALGRLTQITLGQADPLSQQLLQPGGFPVATAVFLPPLLVSVAVMAVPAVLVVLSLVAQRGIVFAPSKLEPKLSRISPIANAKQKFGAEGLFQFAKSSAKLIIVSILLGAFLWARADMIIGSIQAEPGQILGLIGRMSLEFIAVVTALGFLIGAADWLWETAQLQKRNRMTRQELQDETKTSEGDPTFKMERRQRAQAIASNQMMRDVPSADVIVVNPTHYAVALKWERDRGKVPVCVAKGVDAVAARIRTTAIEAGVPIFSDPPTARALHASVEIGASIEPDHYRAVAAAIRFADAIRRRAGRPA